MVKDHVVDIVSFFFRMIRRKLTRIELQLDDTKELEELFTKTQQLNYVNLTPSQGLGKTQLGCDKATNQSDNTIKSDTTQTLTEVPPPLLVSGTTAVPSSSSAAAVNTPIISGGAATSSSTEIQERIGYNPQPHNSSNRFQFNNSLIR